MAIRVANQLRGQLRKEYAAGGRLPGENELAVDMGVSRGTIRHALAILQHEGMISRHQGLGTFANPKVLGIPARIDFAYEFSDLITAHGYQATIRALEVRLELADARTAARLGRPPGEPILRVSKIFLADGEPAIFVHEWMPTALIAEAYDPIELEQSLWRFLERRCHCQMKYVLSEIVPTLAEGEVVEQLHAVAGSPLLKFDEVFFSVRDEPLVWAEIYFCEPMIRFHALRKIAQVN